MEQILPLFLLDVLLLGVLCAFGKLLVVLHQLCNQLLRLQLHLLLLDVLRLQLLGLLNQKDLLVVVLFLLGLLFEGAVGLLADPLDCGKFVVAHLEERVEGVFCDGSEGDWHFAPLELSG